MSMLCVMRCRKIYTKRFQFEPILWYYLRGRLAGWKKSGKKNERAGEWNQHNFISNIFNFSEMWSTHSHKKAAIVKPKHEHLLNDNFLRLLNWYNLLSGNFYACCSLFGPVRKSPCFTNNNKIENMDCIPRKYCWFFLVSIFSMAVVHWQSIIIVWSLLNHRLKHLPQT